MKFINQFFDQISSALEYAHHCGKLHGELKPGCIVFDANDAAYLQGFVTGPNPDELTDGTPDFMAPEQWERSTAPETDQYSMAVIIYLALTARMPFEGQEDPDTRARNFDLGSPLAHRVAQRPEDQQFSSQVSDVLRRATSSDRTLRYSSVREFYLAFKYALSGAGEGASRQVRVFFSYRRDPSSGWATYISKELRDKHGLSVFVDTQQVDSAMKVSAKVEAAIRECDILVCLLSRTTLRSTWVQDEIRIAWEQGKPMIPIFGETFRHSDLKETLQPSIKDLLKFEGVHLLDRRNIHVDITIETLVKLIKSSSRKSKAAASE